MSQSGRGVSDAQGRRARQAAALRRRRARIQWGAGAAAVVVALVIVVLVTLPPSGGDGDVSANGRATLGSPAPEIDMVDFEGAAFALQDYRGTPVVLNFWASWCPFCIAEMPDFERVHQQVGAEVAFLGVNLQDDRGQADRLVSETGVTYRLAADPTGVVYGAFGGTSMPTTVFIDADGTVREVVAGQMSEAQLLATIERNFQVTT